MGTLLVKVGKVDVETIDDDRVAHAVKRDGQFEPESLAVWASLCEGGKAGLVVDVGSYGGLFGIAAKLMKNDCIAFEPNPIMVKRTKANAALNGVSYKVIQVAASDKDGRAKLGFNPNVRLTSGASLERGGPASMEVETMKLDTYDFFGIKKIGAMKIDVEGHETSVLKGALKLIEKFKPVIIIETLKDEDRKAEVIHSLPGYKMVKFLDGRNLLMEPK